MSKFRDGPMIQIKRILQAPALWAVVMMHPTFALIVNCHKLQSGKISISVFEMHIHTTPIGGTINLKWSRVVSLQVVPVSMLHVNEKEAQN